MSYKEISIPPIPITKERRFDLVSHRWIGQEDRYGKLIIRPEWETYAEKLLALDPWFESSKVDPASLSRQNISWGSRQMLTSYRVYPITLSPKGELEQQFIFKPIVRHEEIKRRHEFVKKAIENPGIIDLVTPNPDGSDKSRRETIKEAQKIALCFVARRSLINQLAIGKKIEQEYLNYYGEKLQTEEPIGAYINNEGDKYAIFQFYPDMNGYWGFAKTQRKQEEFLTYTNWLKERLAKLGFYIDDMQVIFPATSSKITPENSILIDLEMAVYL